MSLIRLWDVTDAVIVYIVYSGCSYCYANLYITYICYLCSIEFLPNVVIMTKLT